MRETDWGLGRGPAGADGSVTSAPCPRGGAAGGLYGSATPRLSRPPSRSSRAAAATGAGTTRLTAAAPPRRALVAASWEAAAAAAAAARPVRSPSSAAACARWPSPSAAGGGHGFLRSFLPPPALCGGRDPALVLCACAWPRQRGAPLPRPRARARQHSLTIAAAGCSRVASRACARDTHLPLPTQPGSGGYGDACQPPRHLSAHCATRHSDTRALSHCPIPTSRPHPQPPSPARTTWENRRV